MTKGNYYAKQLECSINLYDAVALCSRYEINIYISH